MKLFCVRHGQTEYNSTGRIQGQFDSQLSPLGLRQCQAVAEALGTLPIDAIVSSPLSRALDSARPIADRLKLPIQIEPRLIEIHVGMFQGLEWKDIDQVHPLEAAGWRSQDPDYRIPGGESRRDLMLRGAEAFHAIREVGYHQAIVVAHGGLLSGAFKALLEIPAERNPFVLANGSISIVGWNKDFRLLTLNETGHLGDARSGGGDL
jgi:broad specificity phosphatase PhoE